MWWPSIRPRYWWGYSGWRYQTPGEFVFVVPYSMRRSAFFCAPIEGRKIPPRKAQRLGYPEPDWSSPPASTYSSTGCARKGMRIFPSRDAREFPFGVFPADSLFPRKISKKVDRLSSLPPPPKCSAREAPSSSQGAGFTARRTPDRIESGTGRLSSFSREMKISYWNNPRNRNHHPRGIGRGFRIRTPISGSALVVNRRLPCLPGPHQREKRPPSSVARGPTKRKEGSPLPPPSPPPRPP